MLFSPEYVDEIEGKFVELPRESAALFNYFNNITLFHKYLDNFKGNWDDTKGNRTIADLRYGEEDCISSNTLIFDAIKG